MGDLKELFKLSIPERILLVEELWSSIERDANPDDFEFTEEQQKEIERRIELIEQGKTKFYSWREVRENVLSNLRR